jgi:hypothetical protein
MLTTIDNPFNPFTQYDEWYSFDTASNHNTASFLARIVRTSEDMSEADQSQAIEDAIDEIVRENTSGLYRKVSQQVA